MGDGSRRPGRAAAGEVGFYRRRSGPAAAASRLQLFDLNDTRDELSCAVHPPPGPG